jgi:hypothetical protein
VADKNGTKSKASVARFMWNNPILVFAQVKLISQGGHVIDSNIYPTGWSLSPA